MSPAIDLTGLKVPELLGLEASIVDELRRRGLVRSNNKPLGDIAEQVVLAARGGVLEPNSTKSHDITTPAGVRIQVKAMGARTTASGKFSPFRSFDFDTALFLVFATASFDLALAREVGSAEVDSISGYSRHTNGKQPTLAQVRDAGVDVTPEMQAAYLELDAVLLSKSLGRTSADAADRPPSSLGTTPSRPPPGAAG